mmetsp:Transcript_46262/g.128586  ORF Transcript_46262/g.128586 Transcript_46262/m.128586 type:complete len:361 (-) Transcript_46262:195-1277(-)
MSGCCGPRSINAWASKAPCGKLEQYKFEAPALGPFGVEIKVKYCGLCGSDVHLTNADGGYKDFTAYELGEPQICGHEVVGEVTGLGSAITHVKLGQIAGIGWQNAACHNCEWCLRGDEQLCSSVKCTCCEGNKGGFADYIRIEDGRFAFSLPEGCDPAATAPLLCGGQTVWTPLRQQTKAGDRVGILGLGGLGNMALKFAGALGCEVTALSSSASKKDEAIKNGAHKFIAHADPAEMEAAAASLDFILVTLATQETIDFTKFFALLRPRGTMCFVGMCPPITVDVFTMGFTMHNITTSNTGGRKEILEMLEFCARHKIGASIVQRPMAEINETISDLHTKNVPYRFVMTNEDICEDAAVN